MAKSTYYPGFFMEGLRKNMNKIGRDSQYADQDLNEVHPEYKLSITTVPASVKKCYLCFSMYTIENCFVAYKIIFIKHI
jgi:hypothetical protein